ncbi:MAG TPA: glycosyltransferase family 4 protein [Terriglobales bacterium]|nr:glycosyltransferase family 4 protein [Terriglobales bacterium]
MISAQERPLNILCVSQYYPPEIAAGGIRISELARHWSTQGHDVTVITGVPNYPTGIVPQEYRQKRWRPFFEERHDGIRLIRTWLVPRPNNGVVDRALNYSSFCFSSCTTGLFAGRPDVVIATSPPLLVPVAGSWLSRWKRVPWIFDVRDLWPESLTAVGAGHDRSLLNRSLSQLADFLYRSCSRVVIVSPAFKEQLVRRRVAAEKIDVIENGVEDDIFFPGPADPDIRREFEIPESSFVVCYLGTIGMAHGLMTLVDAATKLRDTHPNVVFLMAGGGAESERLQAEIRARQLTNVIYAGVLRRERIPDVIRASNACAVLLKKSDLFATVIPTKMLEAMACARPVILGVDGHARQIVEDAQGGVFVEPENASAFAQAVAELSVRPELCQQMGANGRRHTVEHYSRRNMAARYLKLVSGLRCKEPKTETVEAAA